MSPLQQLQTPVVTLTPSLAKLYKEDLIGHVQVDRHSSYIFILEIVGILLANLYIEDHISHVKVDTHIIITLSI